MPNTKYEENTEIKYKNAILKAVSDLNELCKNKKIESDIQNILGKIKLNLLLSLSKE